MKPLDPSRWFWRQLTPEANTFTVAGRGSLVELYFHAADDGRLARLYYDQPEPSIMEFVEQFLEPCGNGLCWLYAAYDKATHLPLAFVYVNGFMGRAGMCHFCFLKAGQNQAHDIARAWLRIIFDQPVEQRLACLVGITPVTYKHALRFAVSLGFAERATIPKACWLHARKRFVDGIATIYQP